MVSFNVSLYLKKVHILSNILMERLLLENIFWIIKLSTTRDVVTFLKVRPAKIIGGPGPPGPLDDYIPEYVSMVSLST